MNPIRLGLYLLAFFWTLLITALIGNVIYDSIGGTPSSINYCMFVAIISWLVLLLGLVGSVLESIPFLVLLVADGLAIFFTFVAAVLLSAKLGVHSCMNADYVNFNDVTTGSFNPTKRCQELQASTAFFWFLFATFCAALVLNFLGGRGSGFSSRGGMGRGGPSMSQV